MSDRKLAMPTPPENVPNVSAPPPPPAILPEVTMVEIKLAVEGEFVRRMKQLEADNARLTAELAELRERLAEVEATSPHQYNWEAHRFIKPPEEIK